MVVADVLYAKGHPNIKATHKTTLEITKEEYVTPRGDCIIAINATKAVKDLDPVLKSIIRRNDAIIIVVLETDNLKDVVLAMGSQELLLSSDNKIIIRKSTYIEPATLGIRSNKAARDIDRRLIERLKNPDTVLKIKIIGLLLEEIESINKGVGSII
ncbi:MAG: DUF371 domain-containing protein [Thermoprotei archaeon]|nr:DUF371 domain-containing protein [Staphylothermus sp.]RLG89334.1 MAG: DUF371 domain-containing protein [Thermoprotei archaeon]